MTEHIYYEVGSDLLDKTNALCDILETANGDGVLVFCNSDSDTDLVQVILRKRGFEVARILSAMAERNDTDPADVMRKVTNKEVSAVITSDTAMTGLNLNQFGMVVHYGIPSDISAYMTRIGGDSPKASNVISLVAPLDFSNFHTVKKAFGPELTQKNLPSKEEVTSLKVTKLATQATQGNHLSDEKISGLVQLVLSNPEKDSIVAMLLHNTLNVLPELKKAKEAQSARPVRPPQRAERSGRDNDYDRNDRGDSYNRDNSGRYDRAPRNDRDDRGGRGEWREPRNDTRGDSRGGDRDEGRRSFGRSNEGRYGDRAPRRDMSNDRNNASNFGEGRMSDSSDSEFTPMEPPKKDIRFYVGHGSKDSFSRDTLSQLVNQHCGLADTDIKRLTVRDRYSFVDFAEENAPAIIEKLAGASWNNDAPFFIKKATIISTPRPKVAREEGSDENENVSDEAAPAEEVATSSDIDQADQIGN